MFRRRKLLVLRRLMQMIKLAQIKQYINQGFMLEQQEEQMNGFGGAPDMGIPFEEIQFMSAKQRKRLRKQNPTLPPYLFMTHEEKANFFQAKSNTYKNKLAHTPQRASKTKKIVKFDSTFEIRIFQQNQKVSKISSTPTARDGYHPEHFS